MARKVTSGVDDIATLYPAVAAQWHPTKNGTRTPEASLPGSGVPVAWLCENGHEWVASPNSRGLRPGRQPSGCAACLGVIALAGENDLGTMRPEIAADWHPTLNGEMTPSDVTVGSNKNVWWLCPEDHDYQAVVTARTGTRHRACPYCSHQRVLADKTSLAALNPQIAAEWHPTKNGALTPADVLSGSGQKVWWISSSCGHAWQASVSKRTAPHPSGCAVCAGKQIEIGISDLPSTHPALAAQWHPTKNDRPATSVSKGSSYDAWWFDAACGHEWQALVSVRVAGNGCSVCHGKTVMPGINDLATLRPDIAAQLHPMENGTLTASDVTVSSAQNLWWQCESGHQWQSPVYARTMRQLSAYSLGCLQCAQSDNVSDAEKDLVSFLEGLGIRVVAHDRKTLKGAEIDIYLPDHKFGIEYNGVYWHSEATGKSKTYHQDKWTKANAAGIRLVQIWEDDYKRNPELVKQMLAHKLGFSRQESVYARKTTVQSLTAAAATVFLEQNHIQGFASGRHYLALVTDGQPVAVLVLKQEGQDLNIVRYATSKQVPGGFTKLLKHAAETYAPKRFITFADHCVSDGKLYESTGFVADKELAPDYMYLVRAERKHKFGYRLAKFKTDPNLQYQDGLTERELAALNGLHRIWDAGKTRYIKDLTPATTNDTTKELR